MSFTTPRTWVADEIVSAATLNTHIRDNLVALNYRPHMSREASSNQEIGSGSTTTVNFGTQNDSDPGAVITYSGGLFTVGLAGLYTVHAVIRWTSSAAGNRAVLLQKNSTGAIREYILQSPSSGQLSIDVNATFRCDASDTIRIRGTQTSGGPLDLVSGAANTSIDITYAGA